MKGIICLAIGFAAGATVAMAFGATIKADIIAEIQKLEGKIKI
jgi:hypothetical protein